MSHRLLAEDHAAAGRDDRVARVDGGVDPVFDRKESFDAVLFDDITKKASVALHDDEVRIEELIAREFRRDDSRGAFADARHSDENDIAFHLQRFNSAVSISYSFGENARGW